MTQEAYFYTAFGTHYVPQVSETVPQRYTFTGREAAGPSAAAAGAPMYYRNRMYSPALGRFGRRDPVLGGDPLFDAYGFATDNPVMTTDALGLGIWVAYVASKASSAREDTVPLRQGEAPVDDLTAWQRKYFDAENASRQEKDRYVIADYYDKPMDVRKTAFDFTSYGTVDFFSKLKGVVDSCVDRKKKDSPTKSEDDIRKCDCCIERLSRYGHSSAAYGNHEYQLTKEQFSGIQAMLCDNARIVERGCKGFDLQLFPREYQAHLTNAELLTAKGGTYDAYVSILSVDVDLLREKKWYVYRSEILTERPRELRVEKGWTRSTIRDEFAKIDPPVSLPAPADVIGDVPMGTHGYERRR